MKLWHALVIYCVLVGALIGTVGYVVTHFIVKYW